MSKGLPVLSSNSSFLDCLNILGMENSAWDGTGFALVTDPDGTLVGTIQDSDLRRWIQKNNRLPNSAEEFMNRDFFAVAEESLENNDYLTRKKVELAKRRTKSRQGVRFVPVTQDGKPQTILSTQDAISLLGSERSEVVIVGLGYVGLTFAAVLAERGHQVLGVDSSASVIDVLNSGGTHVQEEGLLDLLDKNVGRGLIFRLEMPERAYRTAKTYVICVGTPIDKNGKTNMTFFDAAVSQIGSQLQSSDLVIIRSTVPLGTTKQAAQQLQSISGLRAGKDFEIAFAPERTVEGEAIHELQALPQIIGADFPSSLERASSFFHNVTKTVLPLKTSHSAELVKLAGNAYRDYSFAFGNRLNEICLIEGIDVEEVIETSNYQYPRSRIPKPSPGVGGPCLSKDSYILEKYSMSESPIIVARQTNERAEIRGAEILMSLMDDFEAPNVALLGMAFKGVPETNDLRNSPALEIGLRLGDSRYGVYAWDTSYPDGLEAFGNLSALKVSREPYGVAILNNNPKNVEACIQLLLERNPKFIYDPWKLFVGPSLTRIQDLGIGVFGASRVLRRPS